MSYKKYIVDSIISISFTDISEDLNTIIYKQLCKDYEGFIDKTIGLVLAVVDVVEYDEGRIVPGDVNIFYKVKYSVITYMPQLHEICLGVVTQATDFGAFIKIGPMEGLCHVSQIMEDFNSYNSEMPGFIGKETKQTLSLEDLVLTRIVSVSLKSSIADIKIGLTMRQYGLGKDDWLKEPKLKKGKAEKKRVVKKEKTIRIKKNKK